jgi:hypothetical protein
MHRGTFLAFELLSEFAVVGADTRSLDESYINPSEYCKILRLSDHVLFFSSGLSAIKDYRKDIMFDVNQAAQIAFVQSGRSADPHLIGKKFADLVVWQLSGTSWMTGRTWVTGNEGLVGEASFIGGIESLSECHVTLEATSETLYQATIEGYQPHGLTVSGYEDVLWGHMDAADADALKTTAERARHAPDLMAFENDQAALIERAVRVVIDHCGDKLIGGEPAVAILDRKTGFRWFRQPSVCQGSTMAESLRLKST